MSLDQRGPQPDVEPTENIEPARVFPRRLPTTSAAQRRRRAAKITRVTARHFAPMLAQAARRRSITAADWAVPLRKTFEDLGTTFLKFGQLIGSAPGVFGEEVAAEFRSCLDTGPAVPFEQVRGVVEDVLGGDLYEYFDAFDQEPIGRASIAVVHRARTKAGEDVAVKVLRPGVEFRVAVDLDLLQPLLEFVVRSTGEQAAVSMLQQFDGFRQQLGEELDLRNEARAIEHYQQLLDLVNLPLVTVPKVYPALSGGRVFTMEFIEGVPVDDLAAIEAYGADPRPVVQQVVQAFLLTAIRWGNFHGDVHAGNLLFRPDGRIGVIDWGIVARLDEDTHRLFRRMIEAALGDDTAWVDIADTIRHAYGDEMMSSLGFGGAALTDLVKAMMEPVLRQPFGQVSLADVMLAPSRAVVAAQGHDLDDRSPLAMVKRWRERRRIRSMVEDTGVVASDFDRGTFLLSKQLMYFERYGKMYLADVTLFEDVEFFRAALGASAALGSATANGSTRR